MEIFSTIRQIFQSKGETVKLDTRSAKESHLTNADNGEDAIDFIDDNSEINTLKRYDNAFRAVILRGMYSPLKSELTDDDIGKNVQSTVIDSCVSDINQLYTLSTILKLSYFW